MNTQYPINVGPGCLQGEAEQANEDYANAIYNGHFEEALELIQSYGLSLSANSTRNAKKEGKPKLWTALHQCAFLGASKETIEKFIQRGAFRSLKNSEGKTAYDLAVMKCRPTDIVELFKLPAEITENEKGIGLMEATLHKHILDRVEELIKKNNQSLPQVASSFETYKEVAPLFEMRTREEEFDDDRLYYPVPGMYGGFSLWINSEDKLVAESWVRICGGSEMRVIIDKEGNLVDESEQVSGTYA
ncbi:uncharacterized protein LOC142341608 [Convolutriloba macropyga]|uniref:uncharacterized protein LOC142341608 n=1 Tax=Convolutriloba macropyga TaxID=536237 RepID=UPI003F5264BF